MSDKLKIGQRWQFKNDYFNYIIEITSFDLARRDVALRVDVSEPIYVIGIVKQIIVHCSHSINTKSKFTLNPKGSIAENSRGEWQYLVGQDA
jgi:hypothetical protein